MNHHTKIPATAFILIGGESKRFGSPKWAATIDGQRMIDRTWELCDIFENRFVIGKQKPESISYPFIQDELEIQSPINGIYSALNHSDSDSDWNLMISCDLPLMTKNIIYKLWKTTDKNSDAIVPFVSGYVQATCAFYHKRILPQIPQQIENGDLSLQGLLNCINTETVNMNLNENEFTNMNTPDDHERMVLEIK